MEEKPKRRGRRKTRTDEEIRAGVRERVASFRAQGSRLDILVLTRSARDLDRICRTLNTSRRHVVEALIRVAADLPDVSVLRNYLPELADHPAGD